MSKANAALILGLLVLFLFAYGSYVVDRWLRKCHREFKRGVRIGMGRDDLGLLDLSPPPSPKLDPEMASFVQLLTIAYARTQFGTAPAKRF